MILENIEKKIDVLLKQNNLIPEEPLKDFLKVAIKAKKNYYTAVCKDNKDKKFIFKMLISDNESFKRALMREISFSKIADEYKFKTFTFPKLIAHSLEDMWYMRECYDGTMIGDVDFMYEKYSDQMLGFAEQAIKSILEVNRLKIDDFQGEYLKTYPYEKYLSSMIKNKSAIVRTNQVVYDRCTTIFAESSKYLYQDAVICHGDFHPGNIIFQQDRPLILDWACVHIGNMANDFVKFWLSLWQFPEAQNYAYDLFVKQLDEEEKDNFDKNLKAMILYHGFPKLGRSIYLIKHKELAKGYGLDVVEESYDYFFNNLFSLHNLEKEIFLRREIHDQIDS